MNKIQETMEKGVEELVGEKSQFYIEFKDTINQDPEMMSGLRELITKSHQKALLEAVREEVRGGERRDYRRATICWRNAIQALQGKYQMGSKSSPPRHRNHYQ